MDTIKQRYQAPVLVDQGSLVARTKATKKGQCWDGSPNTSDDTRDCSDDASIVG